MSSGLRIPAECTQKQVGAEPSDIHALSGLGGAEMILFTSCCSGSAARLGLVQRLLQALGRLAPLWRGAVPEGSLLLSSTPLGRPTVLLGSRPGPSLSFSHGKGRSWAAVSSQGRVGIDVAWPAEFAGRYPYGRAFEPDELACARMLTRDDTARAAALLWSVKEAAVKAVGTGFHCHDPRRVRVENPRPGQGGLILDIHAGGPAIGWCRQEGNGWLAVASFEGRPSC